MIKSCLSNDALQVGPDAPPYANKILLSPHIYPASVIPRGCTGKGLCNRLSNSWGHLSVKVHCSSWSFHCNSIPCTCVHTQMEG